jgi:hypothetical protein
MVTEETDMARDRRPDGDQPEEPPMPPMTVTTSGPVTIQPPEPEPEAPVVERDDDPDNPLNRPDPDPA